MSEQVNGQLWTWVLEVAWTLIWNIWSKGQLCSILQNYYQCSMVSFYSIAVVQTILTALSVGLRIRQLYTLQMSKSLPKKKMSVLGKTLNCI